MNKDIAISILNISNPYTKSQLKKAYMIKALEYHPDKNKHTDATAIFQNITEAYSYLNNLDTADICKNTNSSDISDDYIFQKLILNFLSRLKNFDLNQKEEFQNDCKNFSFKIIKDLQEESLIKIWKYIQMFKSILNINPETLNKIEEIIKDKLQNSSIIILNPTINNILDNDTYKLKYLDNTLYVPLWKEENYFKLESNDFLYIKCIPDLSNNISIINGPINSDIHINIYKSIKSILNNPIQINISTLSLIIPTEEIKIKNYQKYIFKNKGINQLNNNLDIISKGDIIIHIYLNFSF